MAPDQFARRAVPSTGDLSKSATGGFLVFAVAVLPLLFLPKPSLGGEAVFLWPKVVWLFAVIVPAALLSVRGSGLRLRSFALPIALVGWMLTASAFQADPWRSLVGRTERLDGALSHIGLIVALAGGAAIGVRGLGSRLLSTVGAVGGVVAVGSVLQRVGIIGALADQRQSFLLVDLPSSTIGNRGFAACFLAATLPLTLWRAAATNTPHRWLALSSVSALAIGFGWSRGATLAAVIGIVIFVVTAIGQRRRAAALGVVALVSLALGTVFADPGDGTSTARTFSATDSGRTALYRASAEGIVAHPIIGLGAGGVLRALSSADPADVLAWAHIPATAAARSSRSTPRLLVIDYTAADGVRRQYLNITTKVHNELVDYAVSYGLPAAILAAALFLAALWRSRSHPALVGSLAAFATGLLTWPQVMRTAPVLWTFLGLALTMQADRRNSSAQRVVDRADEPVTPRIEGEVGVHLGHDVGEGHTMVRVGEPNRSAGASVAETRISRRSAERGSRQRESETEAALSE